MYKHKQTKNKTKPDFSVYHVFISGCTGTCFKVQDNYLAWEYPIAPFLAKIQTFAVIYQIQLKIAIEKTVFPVQP
jgi:hypothetical protein